MQLNSVAQPAQVLERIKIPFQSFFKRYFNTNSLIVAILFSLPIYMSIFGENFLIKSLNSIIAILAFYYFLNVKHSFFQTGFFIGIFWFWWVGLSFRYYNLSLIIPFVILFLGIGYGIIFWIIDKLFKCIRLSRYFWAVFLIFGFDYIKPFTFDWLKPEVLLTNPFFAPFKITLFLIIVFSLFVKKNKLFILILIPALFIKAPNIQPAPLKIKLVSTYIPQDKKWDKKYIPIQIQNNFAYIQNAIKEHYDVVVLPESAFPIFLNLYPEIIQKLKNLSKKITIVTGALHLKNKKYYNSTYIFENENMKILDKHVLVPFGEYIPLPFFQKEINEIFFNGASDYLTSDSFGIFSIKNIKFINAICYEATLEELYKLKPKYIIALSNDAWFIPSIQPILQKLLIKVYAKKYHKCVYHSINGYKSYVIR